MSRETTLILLGVLVMVSPFVGLPLAVLSFVLPVLGVFVVLIGITLRAQKGAVQPPLPLDNESKEPELS